MTTDGILLLGATRQTGLEVAKLLAARGDKVTAVVRSGSPRAELDALGVTVITGDAFDPDSLDAAFQGNAFSAVISTLGRSSKGDQTVDNEGTRNLVDAAKKAGVKRFLITTAIGAGDSRAALTPGAEQFLGKVMDRKTLGENHLKESGLEYTILRPGAMTSDAPTGHGFLTQDASLIGTITRADLAQLILDCLDDDGAIGQTYSTIDKDMIGLTGL